MQKAIRLGYPLETYSGFPQRLTQSSSRDLLRVPQETYSEILKGLTQVPQESFSEFKGSESQNCSSGLLVVAISEACNRTAITAHHLG